MTVTVEKVRALMTRFEHQALEISRWKLVTNMFKRRLRAKLDQKKIERDEKYKREIERLRLVAERKRVREEINAFKLEHKKPKLSAKYFIDDEAADDSEYDFDQMFDHQ
jgi:hypothetical protein